MFKTYCRNIVRACYDATLYRETIVSGKGFGSMHMLIISTFIGLLVTIVLGISFYAFDKYDLPGLAAQMPVIKLKNHEITADVKQPYTIKTKDGSFRILIDTVSPETDLYKKDAQIVIGKKILLLKQMNGFKPMPLDNTADFTFNREVFVDFFHKIYFILIVAWPLMAVGQWLSMFFMTLFVAVLSYALTAAMREEYYFETRMRIAAYAVTAPFLISKITAIFTENAIEAPVIRSWFAILLALLYFYVMIVLIRRLDEPAKTA